MSRTTTQSRRTAPTTGWTSAPSTAPSTAPGTAWTLAAIAAELDGVVGGYEEAYLALEKAAEAHREGLRRGDAAVAERATAAEGPALLRIGELDRRRDALINAAAEALPGLRGRGQVTLGSIAASLPGAGSELAARAAGLRTLVARTSGLLGSLERASRSLATHFEGVLRQVSMRVSHSGTYGRRGFAEPGPAVVSGLDIRS